MTDPWGERWITVKELSGGGQGSTFLVRSKTTDEVAVAKNLKHALNEEARTRMFQEVTNLRVVHSAQGKVPKILDGNAEEEYENLEVPLYFVMEKIDGQTLDKVLEEHKALPLEQAVNLVLDLYNTLEIAHQKGILHRDLKPENIMVRRLEPADALMLDFGLSFNTEEPTELTPESEIIDNKFLSLPEGRAIGGDRRDARSDLTCLCGILYYCLTGKRPRVPADEHGLAPHRRTGFTVREKMPDKARIALAESLFDKGFASEIDKRFQTAAELRERMKELLNPSLRTNTEDPITIAQEASEDLLRRDRVTQLQEFSAHVAKLKGALQMYSNHNGNKLGRFSLLHYHESHGKFPPPEGGQPVPGGVYNVAVKVNNHQTERWIAYRFVAIDADCVVYRGVFSRMDNSAEFAPVENWQSILSYPGLTDPETDALVGDLKQTISSAIKGLREEVAPLDHEVK